MSSKLAEPSAAEIQCLRLVAEGVTTSKAIAERTRLSPGTVDTYLSRAARTLGASSRREAAARYVELAARGEGEPPSSLVLEGAASQLRSQSRSEAIVTEHAGRFSDLAAGVRWLFSVPPISGPEHSLTWIEKTFAIVRIAAVCLCFVAVLAMSGAGVLWLAR